MERFNGIECVEERKKKVRVFIQEELLDLESLETISELSARASNTLNTVCRAIQMFYDKEFITLEDVHFLLRGFYPGGGSKKIANTKDESIFE